MLGMTLAHRLAQHGQRVTLCEAAPQLGGLASAWKLGDVVWDRHYHVTLLSDTHLRALLDEIGLESEMHWVETKTGFYTGGKLYSMSTRWSSSASRRCDMWERLRLGGTIFLASKIRNWRRLEKIPVADWLRRWSGRGAFEKIWLPLLRAKLGEAYRKTSAAFIWAHIAAHVQGPPPRPQEGNVRLRARRLRPHPRSLRRSAASRRASKSAATRPSHEVTGAAVATRHRPVRRRQRRRNSIASSSRRRRASSAAPARSLTPDERAALRRRRLPRHHLLVAAA